MFQINDSIFQTPEPVWHENHLLDEKQPTGGPSPIEEGEDQPLTKEFSIRDRIFLKSGVILIRIGNGLVGKVVKPAHKPQTV